MFSSPHPLVIAPRVKEREWAHTMERRKSKYIALQFESWAWSAIYFGLFLSHRCKRKSRWIILGKTRTWYSREDYIRFISVGDNTRVCGYWSSYTTPSAKTENPINANWSHDKSFFGPSFLISPRAHSKDPFHSSLCHDRAGINKVLVLNYNCFE